MDDEKRNGRLPDDTAMDVLPRGVAISWGLVKEPQRGPKREMNVGQIVETALAIADREGLSAVSMSRVAASLGFTAMSLYRYIPSKEDLLLLMQDAACAALPDFEYKEDWRDGMREYVRLSVAFFRKHPWYGDIPVSGVPITPNTLKMVDYALRTMRDLPLNDHEKISFVLLISSYARAFGLIERDFDQAIKSGANPENFSGIPYTSALKRLVSPDRYPDLYPLILSGAYTGENQQESETLNDFEFGLERILDGIEQYMTGKT